ncbi:MAG: imidazole glycerol phosphate synthase subunit HisH [Holophagaceae bacterium]|nr:imidazole glycerol phosphate synthase subunit HisH [Holophagaceae bacterium]
MITLLDYGAGNLASLEGALEAMGYACQRAENPAAAEAESLWLLPGDGHYHAAQRSLSESGWWAALQSRIRKDKPLLGICVGLQLLAEGSEEAPEAPGLGVFPGFVRRLGPGVKVPHMGWSMTGRTASHPAFEEDATGWLYFVHSYALDVSGCTIFSAQHGRPFTAVAAKGRVLGFQPHPEKSGAFGRSLLHHSLLWLGETPQEQK